MNYRVWMHTKPAPGITYYEGYFDVYAESDIQAENKAKQEAYLHLGGKGLQDDAILVVDKVERDAW